jgi:hypothetical protein
MNIKQDEANAGQIVILSGREKGETLIRFFHLLAWQRKNTVMKLSMPVSKTLFRIS